MEDEKKSLNFTVLSTTTVLIFLIHLQGKNINLWRSLIAGSCLMIHPLHQPVRGHGCSHQQFTVQSLSMLCIQGLHRLIGPQQNMATMVQPWRRHLDKGCPSSSLFFKPKVSCRALNSNGYEWSEQSKLIISNYQQFIIGQQEFMKIIGFH